MIQFKKITLEDKDILEKYLSKFKYESCEYSFTTLYIWKDACNIEYTTFKDALIIKKKDFDGTTHFMQPVGYDLNNLEDIVNELRKYKEEMGLQYLFKDIEASFVDDLIKVYGETIQILEDRDNFDYIYETEKLMSLSGKKLHAKKNHYNQFIKNYSYEVKDLKEVPVQECMEELNNWLEQKEDKSEYLLYEIKAIEELLNNYDKFKFQGMAVYVDNKLSGITIGEKANDDMAIVHVEKADQEVKGLYTFINKHFVEKYFSDTKIINREQDLGIPGLRKAKESYKLFDFVKKYIVEK